jgi:hypothetical protein
LLEFLARPYENNNMPELRTPRTGVFDALSMLAHSPEPPARAALERAQRLAHVLQEHSSPAPFVFPTDIGGVQFEWHGGERELDLEILPEGARLAYLTLVGGRRDQEGEFVHDLDVLKLVNWIRGI